MRVYQLTDEDGEATLYLDPLCIRDHAVCLPVGEGMKVEAVEMTEAEYYTLPSD